MIDREHPIWLKARARIEDRILNDPRTLQRRIGPSGIGTECDRCLGHMLAQTPKREGVSWLATIGKAVHAWLADEVFPDSDVHRPEERVSVGHIGDVIIDGSSDLYTEETVIDWKVVGATTQKGVKAVGASGVYRSQVHLYGRGWRRAGFPVRQVIIIYLPRDKNSLDHALPWVEDYDENVALAALARADAIAKAGASLGWPTLLPRLRKLPGCLDCSRYPSYPSDPKPGLDDVIGL